MSKRKYLTREQFLKDDPLETRDVELPSGWVRVRQLSGLEVEKFTSAKGGDFQALYRAVALSVIDPDTGSLLFSQEDVKALREKAFKTLKILQDEILDLNGLTSEAADTAKNG